MNNSSEFPPITFSCPKAWSQMQGDERTRFCDVCNKHVHNLSMMSNQERQALLSADGDSPCVAYFQYLNGKPIDVTALPPSNPLKHVLAKAAAVSIGSMSLLSGCSTALPSESTMTLGMICPPNLNKRAAAIEVKKS